MYPFSPETAPMATNAREDFLKSDLYAELRGRAAGLTTSDAEFVGEACTLILKILHGSGKGPFTMLLPAEEALDRLPIDTDELTPQLREGLLGVLLDTFLYGTLHSDGIDEVLKTHGAVELMTVGGGILKAVHEDGHVLLVDPSGCKARVSGPVFKGPVTICHHMDAVLMWDEWIDPPLAGSQS
jgi:hypothetical protein